MKIIFGLLTLIIVHFSYALSPEDAYKIAKSKVQPAPVIRACSLIKPFKKVSKLSLKMSRRNALVRAAVKEMELSGVSKDVAMMNITRYIASNREHNEICDQRFIFCSLQKYRTMNGVCNNFFRPRWGSANVPFLRLLNARYGNPQCNPTTFGQHQRKNYFCTASGRLPNPRLVSTRFHPDWNVQSRLHTHMLTQFGQFLDHDLTFTPEEEEEDCCEDPDHEGCNPIMIPSGDPFYSKFGKNCIELTRSENFCDSSPREQFNTITSFVDASNVYGSSDETLEELRMPNSHLMRVSVTQTGKSLLPLIQNQFVSGDERANEMPGLATMHNLFLREHNRVASLLAKRHPNWSNEKIFQEARRIIGAEMQNIVYGQFMEAILGTTGVYVHSLKLYHFSNYNPWVNPTTSNSFATAAFRFGHSMIQGDILRLAFKKGGTSLKFSLSEHFDNLFHYKDNNGLGMEELINGLINQPAQNPDRFVIHEVSNLLFNEGKSFGSDLISRNIQRSRDHGLPTYGAFREVCGLEPICTWYNRPSSISYSNWRILKSLYKSPNDIDLFVAGLAETPISGSVLGETFTCLIARQFRALRDGDRYFFTHWGQTGSFNYWQIKNIMTRTLAEIICDNTEIKVVRRNVFDRYSPKMRCPRTSTLNIRLF